jgi:hypothetical protein
MAVPSRGCAAPSDLKGADAGVRGPRERTLRRRGRPAPRRSRARARPPARAHRGALRDPCVLQRCAAQPARPARGGRALRPLVAATQRRRLPRRPPATPIAGAAAMLPRGLARALRPLPRCAARRGPLAVRAQSAATADAERAAAAEPFTAQGALRAWWWGTARPCASASPRGAGCRRHCSSAPGLHAPRVPPPPPPPAPPRPRGRGRGVLSRRRPQPRAVGDFLCRAAPPARELRA